MEANDKVSAVVSARFRHMSIPSAKVHRVSDRDETKKMVSAA